MHAGYRLAALPSPTCQRVAALQSMAGALDRILRLAGALVQAGRPVELAGLDRQVGLLCAQSLDLEPPSGQDIRLSLIALRQQLENLAAGMARHQPPDYD